MGAVGWMTGHGPVAGYVVGELAQRLGRDAPDAIKLATLNFLASEQPVKATGFKAAVDYMDNVAKGQATINKGIDGIFKTGKVLSLPNIKIPEQASLDKLDKLVAKNQDQDLGPMSTSGDEKLGHYMPQHQQALTQAQLQSLQYLKQLKPQDYQSSPLDKPIKPSPMQEARYNRALIIAQSPAVVLKHIQDGTLQATDIQDLNAMYPALYKNMQQKISSALSGKQADGENVPYKTRMSISLFLGQPMDTSMQPTSIMAAQPQPQAPPQQTQQGKAKGSGKSAASMSKASKAYQTPGQAAESDRSNRD